MSNPTATKGKTPSVSIGLPVYNGAAYLAAALDSILAQTWRDFELIIADNHSTDGTVALCRSYAAQDARIRLVVNEQNLGAAQNYNLVFALARGQYFKWASHDDLLAPTFLERCVAVLDHDPAVVIAYPQTLLIDADGQEIGRYENRFDLRSPQPHRRLLGVFQAPGRCHPVFGLIRAAALAETGLIGAYVNADRILLAELALRGPFYEIDAPLFLRRIHDEMSEHANPTVAQLVSWYNPRHTNRLAVLRHSRWRWPVAYYNAVRRARLSPADRLRCYRYVARYAFSPRLKELLLLLPRWADARRRARQKRQVGSLSTPHRP